MIEGICGGGWFFNASFEICDVQVSINVSTKWRIDGFYVLELPIGPPSHLAQKDSGARPRGERISGVLWQDGHPSSVKTYVSKRFTIQRELSKRYCIPTHP